MITAKDWKALLNRLKARNAWEDMWQLITEVPAERSLELLRLLKASGWTPKNVSEREAFATITELAETCRLNDRELAGSLIWQYATLTDSEVMREVQFNPDSTLLVSRYMAKHGAWRDLVRVWSLPDLMVCCEIEGSTPLEKQGFFILPEFSAMLVMDGQRIRLWKLPQGTVVQEPERDGYFACPALSADGKLFALAGGGGVRNIKLWHVSDTLEAGKILIGHSHYIRSLVFSPNGQFLASGDEKGDVCIWSIPAGELLHKIQTGGRKYAPLMFSPDSACLASTGLDDTLYLWSIPEGEALPAPEVKLFHLAFSPGGNVLAGIKKGCPSLWKIPEGQAIEYKDAGNVLMHSLCFSPDGRMLACGCHDYKIRVWSLPDGDLLHILDSHTDTIKQIAFSPDGHWMATWADDNSLLLWRVELNTLSRLTASQTDTLEQQRLRQLLRQADLPNSQRVWLQFTLALILHSRAIQTLRLLSQHHRTADFSQKERQMLVLACQEADNPDIAIQACHALAQSGIDEGINALCLRWTKTRETALADAIVLRGYVAKAPPDARVLSALRTGKSEFLASTDDAEILEAVLNASNDNESDLKDRAWEVLIHLEKPEAREMLCDLVIEQDRQTARAAVLWADYFPRDPVRRALFFVLSDQWKKYETLDINYQFLRTAYQQADTGIRKRIAESARRSGHAECIQAIALPQHSDRKHALTEAELTTMLAIHTEEGNWQELWHLTQNSLAEQSLRILLHLQEQDWMPASPEQQAAFKKLTACAKACQEPENCVPGGLWPCDMELSLESEDFDDSIYFAISPDSQFLAARSERSDLHFWHLPNGELLSHHTISEPGSRGFLFSPNGETLVHTRDRSFEIWDVATREQRCSLEGYTYDVLCAGFTPDGKILATGSYERKLRLWSLPDGKARQVIETPSRQAGIVISPDGKLLAGRSNGNDNHVRLWSLPDGSALKALKKHILAVTDIAFSPDGRMLASCSWDKTIALWNPADASLRQTLTGHTDAVMQLAFSPDGKNLISRDRRHSMRVWSLADRTTLYTLDCEMGEHSCMAVSLDGQLLAASRSDNTIMLWSLADGSLLGERKRDEEYVRSLAFTPDSRFLLSAGYEQAPIRVWNLEMAHIRRLPVWKIDLQEILRFQQLLQSQSLSPAQQAWLRFLVALAAWRHRHDIEVGKAPPNIQVEEFDIELG